MALLEEQIARTRKEDRPSFERNIVYWGGGPLLGKNREGNGFRMDNNLYFHAKGKPFPFAGRTFEEWQARGQDTHSLVADPRFVDPQKGNFARKPGSPALKLGFEPIDLGEAGIRQSKDGSVFLPGATKRSNTPVTRFEGGRHESTSPRRDESCTGASGGADPCRVARCR